MTGSRPRVTDKAQIDWIIARGSDPIKDVFRDFCETFGRKDTSKSAILRIRQAAGIKREAQSLSPFGFHQPMRDGRVCVYLRYKTTTDKALATFLHIIEWCRVNGPLPDGMLLVCLGDKRDTSPENWVPVTRAAHAHLMIWGPVRYNDAPDELKPSLVEIAKLRNGVMKLKRRERPTPDICAAAPFYEG